MVPYPVKTYATHLYDANVEQDSSNCIGGIVFSVLASSAVECGFELWLGQSKDYKIGICCLFTEHAALKRKRNDWLAQNQDNVSDWNDMFTHRLSFQ